MSDCTIKLIGPHTRVQGTDGVWRTTAATEAEVYAKVKSITRSEFFSAGQNGLRPDYQFSVFAGEYSGQKSCEYNGERYAIYRTYRAEDSDYMELYVQREVGVSKPKEPAASEVTEP